MAELAAGALVSRSLLDERFRQVLGRSPVRYLTGWRMHLAEELLADTEKSAFEPRLQTRASSFPHPLLRHARTPVRRGRLGR